ncbi:N-acetylmuramoyl-L-alanine amidase [Lacticaseibacillus chiayiensis]|uniref:N-acetylmuramoyl-L-alanine amidase n=1 Tax=Lacticaseibacillus chiayiensis TaxID=2100821 RepID=A0A4V1P134_9LACO|nr:N-acetylmuramoyl-L-alanine amidase [Lacticaseibacillus chiayiensis]QVI35971.1 N-acetylmuramoyl-L-alanine amidase [Lacticaseibacillus chiayiensis]RXT22630.1 N-acetylmuramoyl-L-alanine amidase [Lacticaseibacillus chiayiensis]UYN55270.1 N-acetylmuramoyl-L-alanine amidase [Lacticaseibacillus chiayiensis]
MKHIGQLKKWPLIILLAVLFGVGAATTSVMANTQYMTVKADTVNVRLGPGLAYGIMGQVKSGNQLTIIGAKNSWYQVRLAGNRIGWVASWLVDQSEAATTRAKVATVNQPVNVREYASQDAKQLGSLNAGVSVKVVYQEGNWTQIAYNNTAAWITSSSIQLTGKTTNLAQPAQANLTQTQSNPSLKVTTNTTTNLRNAAGINAPVVEKLDKGTELTVIKQQDDWYQVTAPDGKTGFVASWTVSAPNDGQTKKAATKLSEATIVLDPGHGGSDTGAIANDGSDYEKTYTLKTADLVANALRAAGANVIMTRTTDKFVDLAPRPATANNAHADAFISFHFDSSPSKNSASGFTTYYYSSKKDLPLAKSINRALTGLPLKNRGVAFGNFEVLRDNNQPAILNEMGYINNDKDFKYIKDPTYQSKIATDIVNGLNAYFKAGNHQ